MIRDLIERTIIENGIYYDCNDIDHAVEKVYPAISDIVFNSDLCHVRRDLDTLAELVTFMAAHLA